MSSRRTSRSELPEDPAATLRALRACRDAMLDVCRRVRPHGPAYHAASMVISAIDGFAAFLTGQRYYFSVPGSAGGTDRRAAVAPSEDAEVLQHDGPHEDGR